uniref:Protein N-terminal glutamine amidohydrolase n=1 Tax=Salix viminalis TaxID=40686 RepID=A0A6N2K961_SALVM
MSTLEVSQFTHTPLYCEENVYFLLKKLCKDGVADADGSHCGIKRLVQTRDGIILWDYHAICIQRKREGGSHLVWDLDSSLPFPSPLASYVSETIRPSFQLFSEYRRSFRIVHAPIFLRFFASDRRHMKDPDGNWTAQPPAYEPIVAEDGTVHNLNEYMEIHASDELKNMEADLINSVFTQQLGVAISENQLEEFFAQIS